MKSKIIALLVLSVGFSFAQKKVYTKASVIGANIYRNSVELENTVNFTTPKGSSEIIIGNVSEYTDKKSIQIGLNTKNISILSSQFVRNYDYKFEENNTENLTLKKINDSIKIVEKLLLKGYINREANTKTLELLDKNQTVLVGSNSSNVSQLTQLTDFYQRKRIELANQKLTIADKVAKLLKKKRGLEKQLASHQTEEKQNFADGVLVLKVSSSSVINTKLSLRYLTSAARWNPFYEIKGKSINDPLDITFKATIVQNTGIDWKGVKLNLINGTSSRNSNAPTVSPWFLNGRKPNNQRFRKAKKKSVAYEKVEDMEETEEVASNFVANAAPVGFNINANQLNISYDVSTPYDILSNNEDHIVSLYSQKIKTDFTYFTAPNYNKSAFLMAKIKDFSKYGLVSAKASVIFENMYIGETYVNPNSTTDEMAISLGDDSRISVKRQDVKNKSGNKFLSSNVERTITYDLIIKNNKKEGIKLEVKDRFPISKNESVKVELLKTSKAKQDDEKGFFVWDLKLKSRETKKIRVSYKVTSPKDFIFTNF